MNSTCRATLVAASLALLPAVALAQNGRALNIPGLIGSDRVNVRQGPGEQYKRVFLLDTETHVTVVGQNGDWVQIRTSDGDTGWLRHKFVLYQAPPLGLAPAQAKPAAAPAPAETAETAPAQPAAPKPAFAPVKPAARPSAAKSPAATAPAGLFAATKPDPGEPRTQDSPAAALGDSWRLLLYLVPILAIVALAVRGLKSLQQRGGNLSGLTNFAALGKVNAGGLKQGLIGGLNLFQARERGGSNIRVVESVPIGNIALHLVEVRDRLLLIGASGASVSILTEFKNAAEVNATDFHSLLDSASADMAADEEDDGALSSMVGSLDDSLREAREIIARSAARTRQWDEGNSDGPSNLGGSR